MSHCDFTQIYTILSNYIALFMLINVCIK